MAALSAEGCDYLCKDTELSANNTASTLATDLANTNRSVGASQTIARNSYSTAMKNASMSEVNANLSNLNSYQNATAQLMAKKQDIMHHPSNLHGALMNDVWSAWSARVGFTIYTKFIKAFAEFGLTHIS